MSKIGGFRPRARVGATGPAPAIAIGRRALPLFSAKCEHGKSARGRHLRDARLPIQLFYDGLVRIAPVQIHDERSRARKTASARDRLESRRAARGKNDRFFSHFDFENFFFNASSTSAGTRSSTGP
jgi:hypothetical protein